MFNGRSCYVEQGHYGHRARKGTWLYAVSCSELPELDWSKSTGMRLDSGFHSTEERQAAMADPDYKPAKRLTRAENLATPPLFADVLIDVARASREGES